MFSSKLVFQNNEETLDESLSGKRDIFVSENIEITDNSNRINKNEYLFWSHSFVKKWQVDIETAQVTVNVSCYEPAKETEQPLIKIYLLMEIFRQSNESRFLENEKHEIPLENLNKINLCDIIIGYIRHGEELIEKAL